MISKIFMDLLFLIKFIKLMISKIFMKFMKFMIFNKTIDFYESLMSDKIYKTYD
jgi:hypothetical protein